MRKQIASTLQRQYEHFRRPGEGRKKINAVFQYQYLAASARYEKKCQLINS